MLCLLNDDWWKLPSVKPIWVWLIPWVKFYNIILNTNKTTSRDWCEPLSQVQLSVLIEVTDQLSKQSIQSQPISPPQSSQLLSQTSIVQLCARIHCEIICHRKNPKSPHPSIPAVRERFLIAGPRDFGTALEFVLFSRHQKQGPSSVPGYSGARCQMKFSLFYRKGTAVVSSRMVPVQQPRKWSPGTSPESGGTNQLLISAGSSGSNGHQVLFLVRNEHLKISISPHIAPASKSPKCKKICQPANKRRIGRLHFFWPGLLLPDLGWSGPTQEYPRRVVVCKQREENAGRMKFVGTDPIWCESVRVLELCWNSGSWSFFCCIVTILFSKRRAMNGNGSVGRDWWRDGEEIECAAQTNNPFLGETRLYQFAGN